MHTAHFGRRAVRVRNGGLAVDRAVGEQTKRHGAWQRARRCWRDAKHDLAARTRRAHTLRSAKLAKQTAHTGGRDPRTADLDRGTAQDRAADRVRRIQRGDLVLETHAAMRVLLLVERQLDADDARRVRRRDAVHLRMARPRAGDQRRVEPAPQAAQLRGARREAKAGRIDERAA